MSQYKDDLELELGQDERLIVETQNYRSKSKATKIFGALFLGSIGITSVILDIMIIIKSMREDLGVLNDYLLFVLALTGPVFLTLASYSIISDFYESRTYFYITSMRVMRLVKKRNYFKIKREIKLSEISHLFDWGYALEIFPNNAKRKNTYNGTEHEDEFSYRISGTGFLVIRFTDPKGSSVREKISSFIIKAAQLQHHPNLDFLYYK